MRNQVLFEEVVVVDPVEIFVEVVAVDPVEIFVEVLAAEVLVTALIALALVWGRRLL